MFQGGAEEVLSFVANSRSEDSLTHVILILLHKECGARLVARFSQSCVRSPHRAGRRGTRLAVIPSRWPRIPKYPPRFLMSPMRLFPFSEGPLSGGGGSFGVFWKCWDPGPCHRCCHRSLRLLQPAPRTTTRLRWLLVSPPPRIFRKHLFRSFVVFRLLVPSFAASLAQLRSLPSWDPSTLCSLLPGRVGAWVAEALPLCFPLFSDVSTVLTCFIHSGLRPRVNSGDTPAPHNSF